MEEEKKEITNKGLVDAIRCMIIDDNNETRQKMVDEVMKAEFIAPVTFLDDEEVVYGQELARKINFEVMKNADGKVMFPAFTDKDELKKVKKEGKVDTVVTNVKTYASMFADPKCSGSINGVVINPMGMSLMLDKEFFLKAARNAAENTGVTQKKFDKDTKFVFSVPKEMPVQMLESLKEYLKYRTEVNKAYFLMMTANEEKKNLLIVVDFEGEDAQSIFEGIGKIAEPYHKGIELGMVPYDNEFGRKATEVVQPFYVKNA